LDCLPSYFANQNRQALVAMEVGQRLMPSALASSEGPKELVWRNCATGGWARLHYTTTQAESDATWSSLCAMDSSDATATAGAEERPGLEWQEALPVVKRLRLQLRRLQQREKAAQRDGLETPDLSARRAAESPTAPAGPPAGPPPEPAGPRALVRALAPGERPAVLWGGGGLCGEAAPSGVGRTRLFINLTAGLELLARVPPPHVRELSFCHIRRCART